MSVQILVGDVREKLRELPEESVHCVVTSPPYWGLRDYGVEGAIGLEPTFEEHLETLVTVFREVRRVLRKDGTCWLNYGDSYAGSWGAQSRNNPCVETSTLSNGQVYAAPKGTRTGSTERTPGLKPKDLMMMPARVALALQADGWWLRSEIIWAKPNPMPESVTDRPTSAHESAHEKVYLLTKSARYFYDAEAVRVPMAEATLSHGQWKTGPRARHRANCDESAAAWNPRKSDKQRSHSRRHAGFNNRWDALSKEGQQATGANLRNVWTISTFGFPGAHFATFPPKLVEPCIKAGTSEKGCCSACGVPWARQVEDTEAYRRQKAIQRETEDRTLESQGVARHFSNTPGVVSDRTTKGWEPSCSCDAGDPIPCTVLDPFGGAGTVGLVADRLGRDAILIELNPDYAQMAERRIHGDAPLLADVGVRA